MGRRWGRGGHAVRAKGAGSGEDPTPEPVGSGPPHQDFGLLDCRTCRLNFCHFKVILCGNLLQGVLSRKRKFCTWNVACSRGLGEVQLVGMVPGIFWLLPCSLEGSYFPDAEGGVFFFFFLCSLAISPLWFINYISYSFKSIYFYLCLAAPGLGGGMQNLQLWHMGPNSPTRD